MSSVPTSATLLQATADYLEQELLPSPQGYHRFQTRIAVNVLRTVVREQMLHAPQAAAKQRRLAELLAHDGERVALEREMAADIAQGRIDIDAPGLVEHLRQTLADALAINNPKWISPGPLGQQAPALTGR